MKRHTFEPFRRISYLLFFLMGGTFLFSSCDLMEDETGLAVATAPPVVERVRVVDPAKADSSFTKSTLGSTIVLVGKNLAATQYVEFNGFRTPVNPVYATDTHLIITIPSVTPTVATDPNVPNKMKVVNNAGEFDYDFTILPPAPSVVDISNEYLVPGKEITLYGQFFYFVEKVTFPGGVVAETISINPAATELTVTVPQGVKPAGQDVYVRVTSASGTSNTNLGSRVYDKNGMIGNFDDKNPFGWGINPTTHITTQAQGISPLDGKFGLINMAIPGGWGWANAKVIHLTDWGGAQIFPTTPASRYAPSEPIANFDAKMEVAVANTASLEGIMLQIFYQNENNKELTANANLKDFVKTRDGKWYTVNIPLSALSADNGQVGLTRYGDILKKNKDGQHTFRVLIVNSGAADVPATIAIDNIRVENKVTF